MLVFQVRIDGLGGYTTEHASIIAEDLATMQRDETDARHVTVEVIEMTPEELEAAPEFKGF